MTDITAADLYREVTGMRAEVAAALTKLAVIETRNGLSDAAHADQESRLRALERFRYSLMGAAVLAGVLAGSATGFVSAIVTAHP
jgi:hypothetical protein